MHKTLTTPERAFHKIVKYKGKKRSVKEWARLYNVSYKVLAKKIVEWLDNRGSIDYTY